MASHIAPPSRKGKPLIEIGRVPDVSAPMIWDWVNSEYRPPRYNDSTKLQTIATRIVRQCAANARAAKPVKGKKP